MVTWVRVALLLTTLAIAAGRAGADYFCTFELGRGQNAQPIGTTVSSGVNFTTATGGTLLFADINTGNYRATSDNGKVYEDGEYFVSGNVAAFAVNTGDAGKMSFLNGAASYVTVGYTSQFEFTIEAYDALDGLLTSKTGAANVKSQGGTGLAYLTVNSPGIAYVIMHDHGGYWMVDNISTDALVPEPGSLCILASALIALPARRRLRK